VKTDILLNGLVAVVLAALVIVLAATWRVGVRKVSVILITVGAVSAVLAWLSSFAAHQVVHKISSTHETNTSLQQQVATIAQTLADDLRSHWLLYGIALIVAGALALVVLKLTQPKNPIDVRPKKPSKYVAQPPSATEETPVIHKPGHRIIASAPTADQNKAPDDNDSPQHNLHI
jgi:hypothetical protein